MSNARQETVDETIDDILRDMRTGDIRATANTSSAVERKAFKYINDFLADYADRIEAAEKREREAGAEAVQICGEIGEMVGREAAGKETVTNCNRFGNAAKMREAIVKCINLITEFGDAEIIKKPLDVLIDIEAILNASISAPPRNCDLYSHDEAFRIWRSLPESKDNGYFDEWLYAEAKGYAK